MNKLEDEFSGHLYREDDRLPRLGYNIREIAFGEEYVPLSEEELRLLEQMERALVEEDPKFASTLRGTAFRRSARMRAILAGVCFAAGIAVLMTGAITSNTPVGIIGFVIMLGAATVGVTAIRGRGNAAEQSRPVAGSSGFSVVDGGRSHRRGFSRNRRSSQSLVERMEQRWRRRRDNGGL